MAENQITLTKRICMASDGYQFLTSGFPNRSRDKKTFDSVDGLFIKKPILEDLRPTEDGCSAMVKLGTLYLDSWCCTDYFPDIPAGTIFPVWVKVTRKEGSV